MYSELMARRTPADRHEKLIAVAAAVFVEHGYARTQMADIATTLGVAKGTIYRSVDSKSSLLAAVLLFADNPDLLEGGQTFDPIGIREVSSRLREQMGAAVLQLKIAEITDQSTEVQIGDTVGEEIESLVLDLFEMMVTHRVRIMVLDRCAPDIPELGGDWYGDGRYAVVDLWNDYLNLRLGPSDLDRDNSALARTIVELVTLWAVKMPWDPFPRPYPENMAPLCAAMIRNLVLGAAR
jgi:AcrR family transcriptional regulator